MSEVTYSKKIEHKIKIKDDEGTVVRVYTFNPMSARYVFTEGTTLFQKLAPVFSTASTWMKTKEFEQFGFQAIVAPIFFVLNENLDEDYKYDLFERILGKLKYDGEIVQDLDEHFDGDFSSDYIQVVVEALWKTFSDFFMGNTMIRTMISPILTTLKEQKSNIGNSFLPSNDSTQES